MQLQGEVSKSFCTDLESYMTLIGKPPRIQAGGLKYTLSRRKHMCKREHISSKQKGMSSTGFASMHETPATHIFCDPFSKGYVIEYRSTSLALPSQYLVNHQKLPASITGSPLMSNSQGLPFSKQHHFDS